MLLAIRFQCIANLLFSLNLHAIQWIQWDTYTCAPRHSQLSRSFQKAPGGVSSTYSHSSWSTGQIPPCSRGLLNAPERRCSAVVLFLTPRGWDVLLWLPELPYVWSSPEVLGDHRSFCWFCWWLGVMLSQFRHPNYIWIRTQLIVLWACALGHLHIGTWGHQHVSKRGGERIRDGWGGNSGM